MTIGESARFTVYRLTEEYADSRGVPDHIYLWDLVKMIKNALNFGFIKEHEAEMLCYNLNVSMEEMREA